MNKRAVLLLVIIILIGIFFRVYRISEYPVQLGHDEISQLYEAISIAQTGKDIYGNFLPTVFVSLHDFKPPFYTYATAFWYLLFGNNEAIIRFTGVLFGILLIPAVYYFTLKLLKNVRIALFAALMTAISPFEIFFSRKGFENGAGTFFMLVGFSFLLNYVDRKRLSCLYFGLISLAVGMYTYFSHVAVIPLVLIAFFVIYRDNFNLKLKKYWWAILLFILLLIPLLLIIYNPDSRYRSQTVFLTQDLNLVSRLNNLPKNTFWEEPLRLYTIIAYGYDKYLNQFDPMYLFMTGLDLTSQGPLNVGLFLIIQLPFLLLGVVYMIRKSNLSKQKWFMLSWVTISMLPSGLTFEAHSPHRVLVVFTMFNILTACGLYWFYVYVNNLKNSLAKWSAYCTISICFMLNLLFFLHIYFINFPYEKSEQIHYPFKQVAQFAWSQHEMYDQIVFDPLFGEVAPVIGAASQYYMAYYGNFPPERMQREYRVGNKPREMLFDKFSIRKVEWSEDQYLKNTLVIISPWLINSQDLSRLNVVKTFYFYDHKPAFYAIGLK